MNFGQLSRPGVPFRHLPLWLFALGVSVCLVFDFAVFAQTKQVELPPDLRPEETTAESMVLYSVMVNEIGRAEKRNDLEDLKDLAQAVGVLSELHAKQASHLRHLLTDSVAAVNLRLAEGELVATNKSLHGPLRVVAGPKKLEPGETGTFAILLAHPAEKSRRIQLSSESMTGFPKEVCVTKGAIATTFRATRRSGLFGEKPRLIGTSDGFEAAWELASAD